MDLFFVDPVNDTKLESGSTFPAVKPSKVPAGKPDLISTVALPNKPSRTTVMDETELSTKRYLNKIANETGELNHNSGISSDQFSPKDHPYDNNKV